MRGSHPDGSAAEPPFRSVSRPRDNKPSRSKALASNPPSSKYNRTGPPELTGIMTIGSSSGPDALTEAVIWVATLLTGSAAVSVALLAVAVVGLLMLGGRMPVRRGLTVAIGCFVLFSARTIADGLLSTIAGGAPRATVPEPAPAYTPTLPTGPPTDPYAGAAVPARR